jgi:hypothetical protein
MTKIMLEHLKTVAIDGQTVDLVAIAGLHHAYVSRNVVAKLIARRQRQLAEIKRDCQRLRGLLKELD